MIENENKFYKIEVFLNEYFQALHPLHHIQLGEPRNGNIHLFYYSSLGALFVCARVNTKYLDAAAVGPSTE